MAAEEPDLNVLRKKYSACTAPRLALGISCGGLTRNTHKTRFSECPTPPTAPVPGPLHVAQPRGPATWHASLRPLSSSSSSLA